MLHYLCQLAQEFEIESNRKCLQQMFKKQQQKPLKCSLNVAQ